MEAAQFCFLLCAIWKRTLTYHTDVCKRELQIDAGRQLTKSWPRREVTYYSSEAAGQELVGGEVRAGPAVTGTEAPGVFWNRREPQSQKRVQMPALTFLDCD